MALNGHLQWPQGKVQPGERIRIRSEISDGKLMGFRWCQKCCEAMAASWHDNGEAWEARIALRGMGSNDLGNRRAAFGASVLTDGLGVVSPEPTFTRRRT